ncbi:hypothetical protein NliqN6_0116 [Naganishia liquefaciens]|uniref:Transmembrane protein 135 N-terminal domain-containing protein n=1 Tax=Naganishia liquefaciens TaxID=104408 RepID=A0A8H3TMT1_9TREE|nr:hypothetical protein NliqN6_0116 [Naganishia liquefaciens]
MSDPPSDDALGSSSPASKDSELHIDHSVKADPLQDVPLASRPPNPYRITTTAPGPPVPHTNSNHDTMPRDLNTTETSDSQHKEEPSTPLPVEIPPRGESLPLPIIRNTRRSARRQFLQIFVLSYAAFQTINALGVLLRARKTTRTIRRALSVFFRAILRPNKSSLKSSTFFAAFPSFYRLLALRQNASDPTFLATALPIIVLGPLANLLPANLVTQINLYTLCAAGHASAIVLDARVRKGLAKWRDNAVKRGRDDDKVYVPYFMKSNGPSKVADRHFGFLDQQEARSIRAASFRVAEQCWDALSKGGGWWLFPLTQGLLLDTAVFESDCFPRSYRNVIVARSKRYLPSADSLGIPHESSLATALPAPSTLLTLLPQFTLPPLPHPRLPLVESSDPASLLTSHVLNTQYAPFLPLMQFAAPGHTRAMCATLHPLETSCTRNFIGSVCESAPSAFALVGGYSGAMMLARFKALRQDPRAALIKWLKGSIRGAAFVTLSISNAWAWVCVFQRLLSPGTLTRPRFGLGGMLAGLWIFLVPAARRLELGLYSVRLSMATLWKIGVKKGWWRSRSRLGFAPFALGLAILVHLKRRRLAPMQGWVGKGVTWLDAEWERKVEAESKRE